MVGFENPRALVNRLGEHMLLKLVHDAIEPQSRHEHIHSSAEALRARAASISTARMAASDCVMTRVAWYGMQMGDVVKVTCPAATTAL